jgi:hypothetical protein
VIGTYIRLVLFLSLCGLGLHLTDFDGACSPNVLIKLRKATLESLKIEWKPISVFPDKALRAAHDAK